LLRSLIAAVSRQATFYPKRLHVTREQEEHDEESKDVVKQMTTIETFEERQIAHELAIFTSDLVKSEIDIIGKPGGPPPQNRQ